MIRYTIALACLFALSIQVSIAQKTIDERKKNNIGFLLGINYSILDREPSSIHSENDGAFGFDVGVGGEVKLLQGLYIAPSGVFVVRNSDVRPISVQANINFEYKLNKGESEPYLLAGGGMDFPIDGVPGTDSFSTNYNMSLNIGVGLSQWFRTFMFAPELVYSHGFRNLRQDPINDFRSALYIHQVSLRFKFMD